MFKCLCFVALLALVAAKKSYDGYRVFEVIPKYEHELAMLKKMAMVFPSLDFWKEPSHVNKPVHVMVSPEEEVQMVWTFELGGLKPTLYIEDVQKLIDETEVKSPDNFAYDYGAFNRYADFMTELDNLAAICNASPSYTCTTEVVGQSFEGLDLKVLRINTGASETFWIDSLIHAREWLSGATVMNIVNKMLTTYSTDAEAKRVLESYNWIILPVMNPDGYEYTFTDDRLWRKSRNVNADSTCMGTDLNRNYAFMWGTGGSSSLPCQDTYMGSSAGSEPETQTVQSQSDAAGAKIWLSFHCYGQYWLIPYGDCTSAPNPQGSNVDQVAQATCAAIEDTYNTNWLCGNSCESLYATSGTTADHVMGDDGVYYAYTPELRGDGFVVPPSEIEPSVNEIWNGIVALVDEVAAIGA